MSQQYIFSVSGKEVFIFYVNTTIIVCLFVCLCVCVCVCVCTSVHMCAQVVKNLSIKVCISRAHNNYVHTLLPRRTLCSALHAHILTTQASFTAGCLTLAVN